MIALRSSTTRRLHGLALAGSLFTVLTTSVSAYAAPTPQDQAAAQVLYDDGRAMMKAQAYAQACPKFEESQRLDPTVVTLFNLADCYEHTDRKASAWSAYLEVAASSKRAGRSDREAVAREKANALQPKVSKLIVNVPANVRAEGLVVLRDGQPVGDAQWGSAIPVDNGKHVFEAKAPGKKPWRDETLVKGDGALVTIEVPLLADAPKAPDPPTLVAGVDKSGNPAAASDTATEGNSRRTISLVIGGVGVAGLAVGAAFGLTALSKNAASNESGRCVNNQCTQEGLELRSSARSSGTASTVAFIAGVGLVGTGAVLYLTAPKGTKVSAGPAVGSGTAGGVLRAEF